MFHGFSHSRYREGLTAAQMGLEWNGTFALVNSCICIMFGPVYGHIPMNYLVFLLHILHFSAGPLWTSTPTHGKFI
jgi:hypothetical protein